MNGELLAKLNEFLLGEDVDEVIQILTFLLADSVAQKTDYVPEPELAARIAAMYAHAYRMHCETPDSVTIN